MTKEQPHLPWPGDDDKAVVAEMLRDLQSKHWTECLILVEKLVYHGARNIPQDSLEDIAHEAMRKIIGSLPTFQYRCTLKTWVFGIVHNCIIDEYRKYKRIKQLQESFEESELNDAFITHVALSPELGLIMREDVNQVLEAIKEYVSLHKKPARNQIILDMVLLEGHSLEDAAKAVRCSGAVAGYIVRSAKTFIRKKLGQ